MLLLRTLVVLLLQLLVDLLLVAFQLGGVLVLGGHQRLRLLGTGQPEAVRGQSEDGQLAVDDAGGRSTVCVVRFARRRRVAAVDEFVILFGGGRTTTTTTAIVISCGGGRCRLSGGRSNQRSRLLRSAAELFVAVDGRRLADARMQLVQLMVIVAGRVRGNGYVRIGDGQRSAVLELLLLERDGRLGRDTAAAVRRSFAAVVTVAGVLLVLVLIEDELLRREHLLGEAVVIAGA